ncbi:MAG: indolepyruvate ferredoxin oxidoreductase subunit alpha, partial [Deltaproteobacteria bacterium]|nr:indolepyruvate ferredoxin oxidoreductase subunit alpha [Deltaproteobacteria bacterium]
MVLLSGNEALARGAIEAGVRFAASYPGSPTVEILATLAGLADRFGHYAEWSINEIVALEAVAGASYAGLRAMASMKPDGFNVALDFATSLAYAGTKAGLVIVVGDDPGGHSGVKEEDCRALVKAA